MRDSRNIPENLGVWDGEVPGDWRTNNNENNRELGGSPASREFDIQEIIIKIIKKGEGGGPSSQEM